MERIRKPGKQENSISVGPVPTRSNRAFNPAHRTRLVRSFLASWLPYFTHLAFSASPRLRGSSLVARLVWYSEA